MCVCVQVYRGHRVNGKLVRAFVFLWPLLCHVRGRSRRGTSIYFPFKLRRDSRGENEAPILLIFFFFTDNWQHFYHFVECRLHAWVKEIKLVKTMRDRWCTFKLKKKRKYLSVNGESSVNTARHKGQRKHLKYISVWATTTQEITKLLHLLFMKTSF